MTYGWNVWPGCRSQHLKLLNNPVCWIIFFCIEWKYLTISDIRRWIAIMNNKWRPNKWRGCAVFSYVNGSPFLISISMCIFRWYSYHFYLVLAPCIHVATSRSWIGYKMFLKRQTCYSVPKISCSSAVFWHLLMYRVKVSGTACIHLWDVAHTNKTLVA